MKRDKRYVEINKRRWERWIYGESGYEFMSLHLIASGRRGLTSRSRCTPVPHHSTNWERIGLRDVNQRNLSNPCFSIKPTRKPSLSEIHLTRSFGQTFMTRAKQNIHTPGISGPSVRIFLYDQIDIPGRFAWIFTTLYTCSVM